jgi:hypothetical protein
MPLINFKLKHPDDVTPWGAPPEDRMHWFGLTDSEYWLDLGKVIFYEYSDNILDHWKIKGSKYVDYHLVRLIEDWSGIFSAISEPVPDSIYSIAKTQRSLYAFYEKANNWLGQLIDDPSIDEDSYCDKYDKVIEWVYSRSLDSGHLSNAPGISFFRNGNNLSIIWNAGKVNEEQIPVWTAQTGEIEMSYDHFISEVEGFRDRFFGAMDQQVRIAVEKDWGGTMIDKNGLIKEHAQRKTDFQESINILKDKPTRQTDWDLVASLTEELNSLPPGIPDL